MDFSRDLSIFGGSFGAFLCPSDAASAAALPHQPFEIFVVYTLRRSDSDRTGTFEEPATTITTARYVAKL
jgi:hypothetical protein